jgi:hypothetical protein
MKKFNIKEWQTKHLNEAANMRVEVEEPFNFQKHKNAANAFEIKANPVTIISVDGIVSEEETELTIQFSNKDKLEYYYKYGASMGGSGDPTQECTIYLKGNKVKVDKYELGQVIGQTGTIVGDLGVLYTNYYKANR